MVKPHAPPPQKEKTRTLTATIWLIAVAITGWMLYFELPSLPEAQKRMKLYGIFLKRPPGNTKDQ